MEKEIKWNEYKPNNIYNADSYEAIKKIPDKSIDLIYIDIPYNYDDNVGGGCFGEKHRDYHKEYEQVCVNTNANSLQKREAKKFEQIKDISQGIDLAILDELCRIMKRIYIYIWCSKKQIYDILTYFVKKNCSYTFLMWHKTNPIPTVNNKYLSDTEYCLLFRENGTYLYGSYETKSTYYISEINKKDKNQYEHPTIKPLDLVKKHIINSSNENDVVLDCFLGSGTTAVACKELNRRYIGFELNEHYYKIACDRLNGISVNDRKAKEKGIMNIFDFMEENNE